jgi:hypothetical protein
VALGGVDAADDWLALLQSSATYAWDGVQGLTLASWVDVVQGVSAAAGGSGTTLGTLNGRATPIFNGSGRYATTAFAAGALTQPVEVVSVSQRTGSTTLFRILYDGILVTNRMSAGHTETTGTLYCLANTILNSSPSQVRTVPIVLRAVYNGASSSLWLNGVQIAAGNAGSHTLTGLMIGAAFTGTDGPFIGPIAHVSIYHGARLANAATVAAAAQAYYGIA